MATKKINIKDINEYIGQEIGVSDWVEINQSRVNKFAEATGDFQWVHMDEERAKNELSAGRTIAHNFLLLSLVPQLFDQIVSITDLSFGQNRGADNIQFQNSMPTGSRLRIRLSLLKIEHLDQRGPLVTFSITMEREDSENPILTLDLQLFFVAA